MTFDDNTDREALAKALRKANYDRLNAPDVQALAKVMAAADERYVTPDMWGRFASNPEKAADVVDALGPLGWVKADKLADRLDAAESSSYDTGRGGEPGYEYPIWEEGQGLGRIFAVSASDFIREAIRRPDTTKEPTP